MSQINDSFLESYKQLDKLCMEVFRADKGVTSYIDAMEETRGGAWKVPNWNNDLQKLKQSWRRYHINVKSGKSDERLIYRLKRLENRCTFTTKCKEVRFTI